MMQSVGHWSWTPCSSAARRVATLAMDESNGGRVASYRLEPFGAFFGIYSLNASGDRKPHVPNGKSSIYRLARWMAEFSLRRNVR